MGNNPILLALAEALNRFFSQQGMFFVYDGSQFTGWKSGHAVVNQGRLDISLIGRTPKGPAEAGLRYSRNAELGFSDMPGRCIVIRQYQGWAVRAQHIFLANQF